MATSDDEVFAQAGGGVPSAGQQSAHGTAGASQGNIAESGFKDRDPPPSYDGESPEATFRVFEKSVKLWEWETDVPQRKRAVKLLRQLTGLAKLAVEDMEFEEIACEDGIKNLMTRLREFFLPHLEVALPRAFETAVYGAARQSRESFVEYVTRMDRNFVALTKEGVDLPQGAIGYIIYRQASLTEAQDQRVLTWTEGKFDRKPVVQALRKLDKVLKDKSKGHYAVEGEYGNEGSWMEEPSTYAEEEANEEEFIYVAEGDLDAVYEEEEVMSALASYKEVRQALKDQRNGRGFWKPNHERSKGFTGKGYGGKSFGGKGPGKSRVHIEQLKLRTRCHRCGCIGHWSRECKEPRKPDGGSNGSTGSMASSQKSQFFVVADPTAFEVGQSSFWLKQFVQERRELKEAEMSETSSVYKERSCWESEESGFCGIVTEPFEGVVDTAAEGGLIGTQALSRLQDKLKQHGLRCKWTPKAASAKGVGGKAQTVGVILIPVGIAKINGILEATVIEGDVPLLLPVSLLRTLSAVVNFRQMSLQLPNHDREVKLNSMPSGHVTIDIMQFSNERFEVPEALGDSRDFEIHREPHGSSRCATAMLAQQKRDQHQFESPRRKFVATFPHGVAAEPHAGLGAKVNRRPYGLGRNGGEGTSTTVGPSQLASGFGQDRSAHGSRGFAGGYGRMVLAAATGLGWTAQLGRSLHAGGRLLPDYPEELRPPTFERKRCTHDCCKQLYSSEEVIEGWRQREFVLRGVQGVPNPLAQPTAGGQAEGVTEEGGLLESSGAGGNAERGATFGNSGAAFVGSNTQEQCSAFNPSVIGDFRAHEGASISASYDLGEQDGEHGKGAAKDAASLKPGKHAEAAGERARHVDEAERDAREECQAGSYGAHSTEAKGPRGVAGHEELLGDQCGKSSIVVGNQERTGTPVPMQEDDREVGGEEGRTSPGQGLLQVHASSVRLLRVGEGQQQEQESKERLGGHSVYLEKGGDGGDCFINRGNVEEGWHECQTQEDKKWARKAQLNGLEPSRGGSFEAQLEYEIYKEEEGGWKKESGWVPVDEEAKVRLQIRLSEKERMSDLFEEPKERCFTNKQRKKVFEAFNATVSEVYSPPRVVPIAEKAGLQAGTSFDLETGWDLLECEDEKEMWKKLEREDPFLVIISHPCTPFSRLQEWNFARMDFGKALNMVKIGLHHLRLGAKIAWWQVKRGAYYLYEQPDGARSWEEPEIQELCRQHWRIRSDMCMFGLNVDGNGLNKKSTGLLTNSKYIAKSMQKICDGSHFHVPLLHGLAHRAQRYPYKFCRQIVRGAVQQMMNDKVRVKAGGEVYVVEDEEELNVGEIGPQEVVPEGFLPDRGEVEESSSITEEEKAAVMKLHRSVGHPALQELVRFMRAARVRSDVIRWTSRNFECDACKARPLPKPAKLASIPKSYQPNKVLGIDIVYLPEVGGGSTFPAVSIVDWGTSYQMVERVPNKEPSEVWNVVNNLWLRVFGPPEVIVTDPGREFMASFLKQAMGQGIVVHQIAARAPWQQGRTERHGAHFKRILDKARLEVLITNPEELKSLMIEVEQAKNRFSNRSGFSPVQRQIGQWPRAPTAILSDEAIDPTLVSGVMTDDLERLHEMRRIAQKAFVECNAQTAIRKTLHGRPRVSPSFEAGDYVYVHRVPKARKLRGGQVEKFEVGAARPMWVGPGTIVLVEDNNLWISMMGELWKAAKEQCRQATSEEKRGVEAVMHECKELVEVYKRGNSRAGYKDITLEEWPELEDEESEERRQPPERRCRFDQEVQEIGYDPTTEEEIFDEPEPVAPRRMSIEEPEAEGAARSRASTPRSSNPGVATRSTTSEPTLSTPTNAVQPDGGDPAGGLQASPVGLGSVEPESWNEQVRQSEEASNRLDGVPSRPWRSQRRDIPINPYLGILDEDFEEEEAREEAWSKTSFLVQTIAVGKKKDYWMVDWDNRAITRVHQRKRKARFSPECLDGLPFNKEDLVQERETVMRFCGNRESPKRIEDEWKKKHTGSEEGWWKGETTFRFKPGVSLDEHRGSIAAFVGEKKGQDEVDPRLEDEEGQELWKEADLQEWNKMASSGAVRILSLEESREVRSVLRSQNKESRILPTKVARRFKPAELPGQPPTRKSRLCLRGDKDPDILELERFSPTVNTMSFNILLQVAANENMDAAVADFSNAFCQSRPLDRPNGPLYFAPPSEGIEGINKEQIVQIINGVYGLVDAPLHWRKSLIEDLRKLGYQASKLDPCIWKLHEKKTGKLIGALAIEVDDLFMVGKMEHWRQMEILRAKYKFGKWVKLKEEIEGCSFNGRRVRQLKSGEFRVDMEKFVLERLNPIQLEKGRASDRKALATPEEVAAARGACGSLNWLSKEGRPDASGPSSLLASKLTKLTIEDILAINETVKALKEKADLSVRIQPIPNMKIGVVTDASFANSGFHSQGGHVIIAHGDKLMQGEKVITNVLMWKSGKLQRVVNSTLAAETQSLSRGLADLLWTSVMLEEFQNAFFKIHEWPERLSEAKNLVLSSCRTQSFLKEALAIVDAKSLFDLLSRETLGGGQDRRTAIEIQIIREDLNSIDGHIRWVDHMAMIADGLTKLRGSNKSLYQLLSDGVFQIQAEKENLEERKEAKAGGATNASIRRTGIKENCGCVVSCQSEHVELIPVETRNVPAKPVAP